MRAAPATGEIPVAGGESRGFSARVQGAALFDLIQLECMSRVTKAVRVTSAGRSATLFLREGRLVHAVAGRHTGESALAEVLGWGEGGCERCEVPWPAVETITASLEHVLLRAVQAIDEGRAPHTTPNVLALPARERAAPMTTPRSARPAPPGLEGVDVDLWVQLAAGGDIIEYEGVGGEEFADAIAYATQLVDLVGQLLGLERPAGVELGFARSKCLIHRHEDGTVLALKPGRGSSIEALREKLGEAR